MATQGDPINITRSDFRGITDMYMDTAAYNLDPSFNYYLQDPRELDQRRLRAYKYFMDFYDGKQWPDMMSGTLSSSEWNPAFGMYYIWNEDFNRRTWNNAKLIVDKLISFTSSGGFNVHIPEEIAGGKDRVGQDDTDPLDAAKQNAQEQMQNAQQPQQPGAGQNNAPSGGNQKNNDQSSTDSSDPSSAPSGDQAPGNENYDPNDSEPDPVQLVIDNFWEANNKEFTFNRLVTTMCVTGDCFVRLSYDPNFWAEGVGELKIDVLDSRTVIPYFDAQDKTKMIACKIQYPIKQSAGNGEWESKMWQEIHTATTIVQLVDGQPENIFPNPLGELMVVHIPNEPLPYRKFGRSDLEALILPAQEYNEKVSDLSEILAYHAAPITVVKGARVNNLDRGARKIWGGIPKDGDVFNLELNSDMASSLEYIDRLRKHLFELGNVPEQSLGDLQEVSNTAAAALHLQYQPIIERTQKKQITIEMGLKSINSKVLKFYEMATVIELPEDIPPSTKYRTIVEFGDCLPRDRSIDLQDISTEMGLGIESKQGAMKRLDVENPKQKIKEIEGEQVRQADLDYHTAGMAGMMPDGQPGTKMGAEDGPQNDVAGAVKTAKTNPAAHGNNVATQAVKNSAQTNPGSKQKY